MSHYTTVSPVCVTDADEEASSSIFDDVHTPSNPDCWCHYNTAYHEAIHNREATPDEIEDIYAFHQLSYAGGASWT